MPRKIERQMISAMLNGRSGRTSWQSGNTGVVASMAGGSPVVNIFLHSRRIATWHPEHNALYITLAGWPTVTTRSRIEAILQELVPGWHVCQRAHEQYLIAPTDELQSIGSHQTIRLNTQRHISANH